MIKTMSEIDSFNLEKLMLYLLERLEDRVGKKNDKVQLSSPKYADVECPITELLSNSTKRVLLTQSTEKDQQQRFFQMSHEVVHLLKHHEEVDDYKKTTRLEEAFATFNSIHKCSFLCPCYKAREGITVNYYDCLQVLEKIGTSDDIFYFIKNIRAEGFELSSVSENCLIKNCNGEFTGDDVKFLLGKFNV